MSTIIIIVVALLALFVYMVFGIKMGDTIGCGIIAHFALAIFWPLVVLFCSFVRLIAFLDDVLTEPVKRVVKFMYFQ